MPERWDEMLFLNSLIIFVGMLFGPTDDAWNFIFIS